MRKRRSILIIVLAVALGCGIVAYCLLNPGPSYQGHNVAYWFHTQGQVRTEAFMAMGPKAVPFLISQINYREPSRVKFYRAHFPRLPKWIQRQFPLSETEEERQGVAVSILRVIGPPAGAAVPDLIGLYTRTHAAWLMATNTARVGIPWRWSLGVDALYAISEIGGESDQIVPTLLGAMRDRFTAHSLFPTLFANTNLTRAVRASLPMLLASLRDPDSNVRGAAVRALRLVVRDDRDVVDHLLGVLGDEPFIRSSAIVSLASIRNELEIRDITEALTNIDAHVRSGAAEALGKIGPPAKMAVSKLSELILPANEPDAEVRHSAAEALWTIDHQAEPVIPYRIATLSDKDDPNARWGAASFLGQLGPQAKAAMPALLAMLAHDKSERLRAKAAITLAQIGSDANEVIPALREALKDEYPMVQDAARDALKQIQTAPKEATR